MSASMHCAVICRSDTANEDAELFPGLFPPFGGSSEAHSRQQSGSLPCGLGKCDVHHVWGKPVQLLKLLAYNLYIPFCITEAQCFLLKKDLIASQRVTQSVIARRCGGGLEGAASRGGGAEARQVESAHHGHHLLRRHPGDPADRRRLCHQVHQMHQTLTSPLLICSLEAFSHAIGDCGSGDSAMMA